MNLPVSDFLNFVPYEGSDELLIICSQVAVPRGKFGLSKFFGEWPINKLYINTLKDDWYINGLADVGNVERTMARVRKWLDTMSFKKVSTFGVSMGGFGAIFFGAHLKVDQVYAFGAEHELFIPFSKSKGHNKHQSPTAKSDFRALISNSARNTRFTMFAGSLDLVDMYSMARLADIPGVDLFYAENVNHSVTTWLNEQGKLVDFLQVLFAHQVSDEQLADFQFVRMSPDNVALYSNVYALLVAQEFLSRRRLNAEAEAIGNSLIALLPGHPLVIRLKAKQLSKVRDYQGALSAMEMALALTPDEAKLYKEAAVYASKGGKTERALELIEKCLSLNANKLGFIQTKLEILLDAGMTEQALAFSTRVEHLFATKEAKITFERLTSRLGSLPSAA